MISLTPSSSNGGLCCCAAPCCDPCALGDVIEASISGIAPTACQGGGFGYSSSQVTAAGFNAVFDLSGSELANSWNCDIHAIGSTMTLYSDTACATPIATHTGLSGFCNINLQCSTGSDPSGLLTLTIVFQWTGATEQVWTGTGYLNSPITLTPTSIGGGPWLTGGTALLTA
jgi:hypothetical protein